MSVDLWQRGCERLAAELPEQQFNTWIRPLPPADISDGDSGAVVSLRVPNRFKLDWIRSQYAVRIEGLLSELAGKPIRLELSLAPRDGTAATSPGMATPGASGRLASQRTADAAWDVGYLATVSGQWFHWSAPPAEPRLDL
jgi:chromosomal replication initiator protein